MLTITRDQAAEALGLVSQRVGTLFKDVPFVWSTSGSARKLFDFSVAITAIKPMKYRCRMPAMLSLARDDGSLLVDHDDETALSVVDFIEGDVQWKQRLYYIRKAFTNSLVGETLSSVYFAEHDRVRNLLASSSFALPFIISGIPAKFPTNWESFSRAFCIINQRPAELAFAA